MAPTLPHPTAANVARRRRTPCHSRHLAAATCRRAGWAVLQTLARSMPSLAVVAVLSSPRGGIVVEAGASVPGDGPRPARLVWIATLACVVTACHREPPPAKPGTPVPVAAELVLDTMDAECNGLVAALVTYKQCPNLDDDDRWSLDAWSQRAQEDFAAGKKANPDAGAQRAIAAACRKAAVSVAAATERCNAGPRPRRS